jgi:hypothetical protein
LPQKATAGVAHSPFNVAVDSLALRKETRRSKQRDNDKEILHILSYAQLLSSLGEFPVNCE